MPKKTITSPSQVPRTEELPAEPVSQVAVEIGATGEIEQNVASQVEDALNAPLQSPFARADYWKNLAPGSEVRQRMVDLAEGYEENDLANKLRELPFDDPKFAQLLGQLFDNSNLSLEMKKMLNDFFYAQNVGSLQLKTLKNSFKEEMSAFFALRRYFYLQETESQTELRNLGNEVLNQMNVFFSDYNLDPEKIVAINPMPHSMDADFGAHYEELLADLTKIRNFLTDENLRGVFQDGEFQMPTKEFRELVTSLLDKAVKTFDVLLKEIYRDKTANSSYYIAAEFAQNLQNASLSALNLEKDKLAFASRGLSEDLCDYIKEKGLAGTIQNKLMALDVDNQQQCEELRDLARKLMVFTSNHMRNSIASQIVSGLKMEDFVAVQSSPLKGFLAAILMMLRAMSSAKYAFLLLGGKAE